VELLVVLRVLDDPIDALGVLLGIHDELKVARSVLYLV
jgi:hypothetical protein